LVHEHSPLSGAAMGCTPNNGCCRMKNSLSVERVLPATKLDDVKT
jgi:hypothetical protein